MLGIHWLEAREAKLYNINRDGSQNCGWNWESFRKDLLQWDLFSGLNTIELNWIDLRNAGYKAPTCRQNDSISKVILYG